MKSRSSAKCLWEFADSVRQIPSTMFDEAPWGLQVLAYATLLEQGWLPESGKVDKRIQDYLEHVFRGEDGIRRELPVGRFTNENLSSIVLSSKLEGSTRFSSEFMTSDSLVSLAVALLDVKKGDAVADLCNGIGSFMVEVCKDREFGSFFGIDINYSASALALMRASILGGDVDIEVGDMLEHRGRYDKIFLNAPFGMSSSRLKRGVYYDGLDSAAKAQWESIRRYTSALRSRSADWSFVLTALESLKPGGRMVAVVPNGPLYNAGDMLAREYLVSRGFASAVVALPERICAGTRVEVNLLVLERNSRETRFVNATDLGEKGRRFTTFGPREVKEVINRLSKGGSHTKTMRVSSLEKSGWSLDPRRYIGRVEVEYGVPLASCLRDTLRGANVRAADLDERITEERTPYRYLMIRDVDEGRVNTELPYLTRIERREERYCLEDGDVVLGRTSPFKAAAVRVEPGEKILCTGNFYILRPDTRRIDSTYLALFLGSDLGVSQLKEACVGSSIKSLPMSAFDEIKVPRASLDEQLKIAAEYEVLKSEIEVLSRRIERARAKIDALFPKGGEA